MIFKLLFYINIFVLASCLYIEKPGPRFPPTKGEIWPRPQVENKRSTYFKFSPEVFKFYVTGKKCDILKEALARKVYATEILHSLSHGYKVQAEPRSRRERMEGHSGYLLSLSIMLTNPCEKYPYMEMDEAYNLTISYKSELRSDSIWGILRGLESFIQLLYLTDDYNEIRINHTAIIDYPRYAHRGLLLDTSRHYISVRNIQLTLDAMAMNKMNVFHWHIVDDQSFPYVSDVIPELSNGAFHPTLVYTKNDIRNIVKYARNRGIRVIPEIDVPGHTRSWGVSHPEVLTECYSLLNNSFTGLGPMNPIRNATYDLLETLLKEVQQRFPDKYFHIGGDEVNLDCWLTNPEIIEYMSQNRIDSGSKLHSIFMNRAIPLLNDKTVPIVWQEVFDEKVSLSKHALIHVWKSTPDAIHEMKKVLINGYKVLFSSAWYLDHLNDDWFDYYKSDPKHDLGNVTLSEGIIGGEACMWGEMVDDNNVISRVWPRASAVAERLWSAYAASDTLHDQLNNRLEEHACRMNRNGIAAQPPNGPGFCLT